MNVYFGVTSHPRVDQEQAVPMVNEVSLARLDPRGSGASLLARADEVAKIHTSHHRIVHGTPNTIRREHLWRCSNLLLQLASTKDCDRSQSVSEASFARNLSIPRAEPPGS